MKKLEATGTIRKGEVIIWIRDNIPHSGIVEDVVVNYDDEVVVLIQGMEGYLSMAEVYSRKHIDSLFQISEVKK